jgi:hypothetical protein
MLATQAAAENRREPRTNTSVVDAIGVIWSHDFQKCEKFNAAPEHLSRVQLRVLLRRRMVGLNRIAGWLSIFVCKSFPRPLYRNIERQRGVHKALKVESFRLVCTASHATSKTRITGKDT